jgi:hypothetical protein
VLETCQIDAEAKARWENVLKGRREVQAGLRGRAPATVLEHTF